MRASQQLNDVVLADNSWCICRTLNAHPVWHKVFASVVRVLPPLFYWKNMMSDEPESLLKKHRELVHSDMQKVVSHVQREEGEWFINTLMIEGYDVPFKYKRKQRYKGVKGQRVNLTYYPGTELVAGFQMEVMTVVRVKIA